MKDKVLQELVDDGRWDDLENHWMERLEAGEYTLDDLLEASRMLGRQREKGRAGMLMAFLEEHLRETAQWTDRLRVLKEIARHTPDVKKIDDLRDQIRDSLRQVYPSRPSFSTLLRHYQFEDHRDPAEIASSVDHIEEWLRYDVGQLFYQTGYGVGRVTEINPKLGVLRIDFDKKKDITVQVGDRDLIPLGPGHLLRQMVEAPEEFRKLALDSPATTFGELLRTFGRPMSVGEIKDCLGGALSAEWSRWWTAAKKNPQVIAAGKGAQAEFSWSDSASEAEKALRDEFDGADVWKRITIAKQNASRGGELAQHFQDALLEDARTAFRDHKPAIALELLELFGRWPGKSPDPGFSFEQVVRESDPAELLTSLTNSTLKMKVLASYPGISPDSWKSVFSDHFLREDNPKALTFLFQQLQQGDPDATEVLLNRVFGSLHAYPPVLVWLCEYGATEGLDTDADPVGQRLEGRFLVEVIEAIDSSEFSAYRNRIKKAIESGLLMNVLNSAMDPEIAQKAVERLEHTRYLEDYRRDRWRNFIRSRIPETKKKEEVIFSTKEAFERKRIELEHLIKVELPTNRKAIGEAAAHGDLRENHEYKAARERQDYLINRVQQLQVELGQVRVLEPGTIGTEEVRPGTKVHLVQVSEKRMTLTILGPWDSDPQAGVYSYQAPIGILLLGKQAGDRITWNDESWTVEKIEPWI